MRGLATEQTRVRGLRSRLGLSQEKLAQLLGVSLQTVRRWESGLSRPIPIIRARLDELQREVGVSEYHAGGIRMKETREKGVVDVEIGMGGLLKGLGNLFDLVSRMAEEGKEEHTGSGEVEVVGGKLKGVYGFSVRMGQGGKPLIQQFGNVRETGSGTVVAETREPLVDVLDEGDQLVVIAEIPGVEEKDIQLKAEGDILEIAASGKDRKYQKEVLLPSAVDSASLESSYRNGVLEIRLQKKS